MHLHVHISTNTPQLHTSQHQPTEKQHVTINWKAQTRPIRI